MLAARRRRRRRREAESNNGGKSLFVLVLSVNKPITSGWRAHRRVALAQRARLHTRGLGWRGAKINPAGDKKKTKTTSQQSGGEETEKQKARSLILKAVLINTQLLHWHQRICSKTNKHAINFCCKQTFQRIFHVSPFLPQKRRFWSLTSSLRMQDVH